MGILGTGAAVRYAYTLPIEWADLTSGGFMRPGFYLLVDSLYPRPLNDAGFYLEEAPIFKEMQYTDKGNSIEHFVIQEELTLY